MNTQIDKVAKGNRTC